MRYHFVVLTCGSRRIIFSHNTLFNLKIVCMKHTFLLLMLLAAYSTFGQITGSGTLYNVARFTGTTQIGNSQLYDNGINVGVGTTSPAYKLDVRHSGSNGILSRSSTGYSVVDIDAANGDAGVRIARAGAFQWYISNNYLTNGFQIYEFGFTPRLFIQDATGNVGIGTIVPSTRLHVVGDLTVTGVKAFTIDHPLDPENKLLRHFAIESNEVLNSYSGNVTTNEKGVAQVQLPDYFEAINKDFRYQLTVIGSFAQAIVQREIKNNSFEIATNQPNVKVSWEVKAVRNDKHMQKVNKIKDEELKTGSMKGKYYEPEAYGLPESRGLNYDPGSELIHGAASSPAGVEKEKQVVKN